MRFHATIARVGLSLALILSAHAAGSDPAGSQPFWQTPAVPGFGRIHPLPDAAYQPDKSTTYKIVFELTTGGKGSGDVSPSLNRLARTVNLYRQAGVPANQLKFVAVADGTATMAMLNDEQYQHLFGVKNPNLPLIAELRAAGVDIGVCGQAVGELEYEYGWIDRSVTVTLSALTTLTVLQQQGYALMRL